MVLDKNLITHYYIYRCLRNQIPFGYLFFVCKKGKSTMARATAINFLIEDEVGRTSSFQINVPSDTTVADAKIATVLIAEEFESLILGRLYGATMTIDLSSEVNPGNANAPAQANSDVQEKGTFIFGTNGGFTTRVNIPTLDESVVLPGTANLDPTETAPFTNYMLAGVTPANDPTLSTTVQPCDTREDDLTVIEDQYESFSGRRRTR